MDSDRLTSMIDTISQSMSELEIELNKMESYIPEHINIIDFEHKIDRIIDLLEKRKTN